MAETPLADRVTILETKMEKMDPFLESFDKTLEARFRAQAEMLDERFAQVFTEMDRRFTPLEKDIAILREGMKILLERVR